MEICPKWGYQCPDRVTLPIHQMVAFVSVGNILCRQLQVMQLPYAESTDVGMYFLWTLRSPLSVHSTRTFMIAWIWQEDLSGSGRCPVSREVCGVVPSSRLWWGAAQGRAGGHELLLSKTVLKKISYLWLMSPIQESFWRSYQIVSEDGQIRWNQPKENVQSSSQALTHSAVWGCPGDRGMVRA